MSVASAQLEEGTILVDPASGNVTSIPSNGGRFASFQVYPTSRAALGGRGNLAQQP